jgi:hypothetical protein
VSKDGAGGTASGSSESKVEVTKKIEVVVSQAEIIKIDAKPGEILIFKFKGDEFVQDDVQQLGLKLRPMFPRNKVIVLTLPGGHDLDLTVVKEDITIPSTTVRDVQELKDCSNPTQYCNNCNCGKKEQIEAEAKKGDGKF